MSTHKKGFGVTVGALAVIAFAVVSIVGASGAGATRSASLPRSQTLYMSGNQWSPNNDANPAKNWDYVTGLVGFAYETPFRYNPLKDQFIPWLATGGKWTTPTTYTMNIRQGVMWSDGKPMTASDVAYSFNLLKLTTHPQHALFADTGLKSVKVSGNNVVFSFAGKPGYQEFDFYRFNVAVVPQHVFSKFSNTDIATGNLTSQSIVGTGPYLYQSGFSAQSPTMVWKRNDNWWAIKALGLKVGPTYVVDIKNGTNAAALANFQAGNIDLFNNFAPKAAIKGSVKTYFSGTPYHLGANTVWLFPNTTEKPLNDPQFRRALAYSINLQQILDKSYQGMAAKASPTGLLPIWNKWINKGVVSKYGFSYNVAKAKATLAAAGYKDTNGDGYVENKDGSHDRPQARGAERLVGLDDRDAGDLRQREGRRDQGHARVPGVRHPRRRPGSRELRPRARQRPAVQQHAVDVLPVHLPAASLGQPDLDELRAVHGSERLEPDAEAGQDAVVEHRGVPVRDDAARDHVPAEPARDSAVVQRHVGDVQHEVLDELALLHGQPVHAQLLAELLPDDEHRHVHASAPRQDVTGAKGAPTMRATPLPASIREGCSP